MRINDNKQTASAVQSVDILMLDDVHVNYESTSATLLTDLAVSL